MRIYIDLAGFSLNLDLNKKKVPAATESAEQPPTQLATPMRTIGYAMSSAGLNEAAYVTNLKD